MRSRTQQHLLASLVFLLLYCLTRFYALLALPVFLDEAVHIRWAQSMWTVSRIPWQALSDGRLVNIAWIAVFWPFEGGLWLGRAATILLGVAGLAALIRMSRALFGPHPALLAGLLYVVAPLGFFFDRMALADSISASLISLSLFSCWQAVSSSKHWFVLPASIAFTAMLFVKLNNVLFLFLPALMALMPGTSIRRLILIYVLTGSAVAILLLALVGRGHSDLGLDLVSARTGGAAAPLTNAGAIAQSLWAWLTPGPAVIILIGGLVSLRRKQGWAVLALALIPLAGLALISRTIESRFLVPILPGLTLIGSHTASLLRYNASKATRMLAAMCGAVALIPPVIFIFTAYFQPGALALPPTDDFQYISGWPSGFGLPQAAAKAQGTIYVEELAYIPMLAMYLPPEHNMTGVWNYQASDVNLRILGRKPDEIAGTKAPGLVVVSRSLGTPEEVWQSRALRLFTFTKPGGQNQLEVWQLP